MADRQISPGNAHSPSRLYLPHLRPHFPCRYGALKILAFSPSVTASYALSVRQASALPAASFRFHLTADTLAVRLTVPPAGSVGDLHPQVSAPCRAHKPKRPPQSGRPLQRWISSIRLLREHNAKYIGKRTFKSYACDETLAVRCGGNRCCIAHPRVIDVFILHEHLEDRLARLSGFRHVGKCQQGVQTNIRVLVM